MGLFSKLRGLSKPGAGDQPTKPKPRQKRSKESDHKKRKHHKDRKSSPRHRESSPGPARRKKRIPQESSQPPQIVHITKNRPIALSPLAREKSRPKPLTPNQEMPPVLPAGATSMERMTFAEYLTGVRRKPGRGSVENFPPGLVPAAFPPRQPLTAQLMSAERPKPTKSPGRPKEKETSKDKTNETQTAPTPAAPATPVTTTPATTPATTTTLPPPTPVAKPPPPPPASKVSVEKTNEEAKTGGPGSGGNKNPKQAEADKMKMFVKVFVKNHADDVESMYDKIKGFIPKNFTRHLFDENMDKCRFADIICMDQTRVTLEDCATGSFIHANFVYSAGEKYILTQCPTAETVFDFWHLIWQENASAVVNIMTAAEMKEHCEPIGLLPDSGRCRHVADGFTVTFQKCVPSSTGDFKLFLYGLIHENEYRQLAWFQYTAWPEGRAPAKTDGVLQVLSLTKRLKKPLVIMSTAGAGRAGAFATLEVAHHMLHAPKPKKLLVNDCIQRVREGRIHALQSLHQYKFVILVLIDHILASKKIKEEIADDICEKFEQFKKETLSKMSEDDEKPPVNVIS